jgi:hypothetical protein
MTPSLPDFAVWFTDQAERVVAHGKRAVEAREWAARLAPSCKNCVRDECLALSLCSDYLERPEVAREREIAAAAFEALTAEVQ